MVERGTRTKKASTATLVQDAREDAPCSTTSATQAKTTESSVAPNATGKRNPIHQKSFTFATKRLQENPRGSTSDLRTSACASNSSFRCGDTVAPTTIRAADFPFCFFHL